MGVGACLEEVGFKSDLKRVGGEKRRRFKLFAIHSQEDGWGRNGTGRQTMSVSGYKNNSA